MATPNNLPTQANNSPSASLFKTQYVSRMFSYLFTFLTRRTLRDHSFTHTPPTTLALVRNTSERITENVSGT